MINTMAKFPAIFLVLFLSIATASCTNIKQGAFPNNNISGSSIYICDPNRFSAAGLDMSFFSYCDKSLPYDVRVKDLVDRMTIDEKVQQLGNSAAGVPRIGLPKYEWWSEALHGVSDTGPGTHFGGEVPGATIFPTPIFLAASFNATLWKQIAQIVSTEARAMHNLGQAGLTFWSPNINVVRDPRWGRLMETPGEDPYVVGRYAVEYVRGLQDVSDDDTKLGKMRPLKVAACCKHYAAYDLENWSGVDRFHFDARVTEQDMVETFVRPFQMCVKEGDVSSVMCSYNQVNGLPTCADPKLLNETIRYEWELNGYIVSDCDSVGVMIDQQKWLNVTGEEAVAQALRAGLDLDCGRSYPKFLVSAMKQGKVREEDLDRSLSNLYLVLMRLGYFDGSQYDSLGKDDICTDANIFTSAEAARSGIVLLKNENNQVLPLDPTKLKSLAIIGPHGNASTSMIGNYAGVPCRYTTPLDGFSTYVTADHLTYAIGCPDIFCRDKRFIPEAVEAAKNADATVIIAGLNVSVEAEALDRSNLLLPGFQTELITQVSQASKGPVILVIMSGGGVDISFAKNSTSKVGAIIWAGYPGQDGGRAIADVVFGKYNPAGRLPITWYEASYVDAIPMTSMQLRPVDDLHYPGRTYKFFNGTTVYPFGYGLSYTNFTYQLLNTTSSTIQVPPFNLSKLVPCRQVDYQQGIPIPQCASVRTDDINDQCVSQNLSISFNIRNQGNMDGDEVVIIYSKPPIGVMRTHAKQVIGFQRVFLPAGQDKLVEFSFNACDALSIVDYKSSRLLLSGNHTIVVGDGSAIQAPVQVSFNF